MSLCHVYIHSTWKCESPKTTFRNWFSSSTTWVQGTQPISSGLVTGAFSLWAILLAYVLFSWEAIISSFSWRMSLFQSKYGPGLQESKFLLWQFSQLGFSIFLWIHLSLSIWISLGLEGCFDPCGRLMTSSYSDLNWSQNWKHLWNVLRTESRGFFGGGLMYFYLSFTKFNTGCLNFRAIGRVG